MLSHKFKNTDETDSLSRRHGLTRIFYFYILIKSVFICVFAIANPFYLRQKSFALKRISMKLIIFYCRSFKNTDETDSLSRKHRLTRIFYFYLLIKSVFISVFAIANPFYQRQKKSSCKRKPFRSINFKRVFI
jgi:predicted nucleic acid binding AN1-type Zn finger protein